MAYVHYTYIPIILCTVVSGGGEASLRCVAFRGHFGSYEICEMDRLQVLLSW